MRALTASMTSFVLTPVRATTTPPTASCVPFTSDATRKASPIWTFATCSTYTGTPFDAADDDSLDVVDGRDQPDAAHDQPGAVRLEHVAADIQVAGADGRHHRAERQVVGPETVRIDVDLVLLDIAADGGDFRDARHGIELIADEPVLQRAQIAE